jgi:hypothetical protein
MIPLGADSFTPSKNPSSLVNIFRLAVLGNRAGTEASSPAIWNFRGSVGEVAATSVE